MLIVLLYCTALTSAFGEYRCLINRNEFLEKLLQNYGQWCLTTCQNSTKDRMQSWRTEARKLR